ncbi:DUF7673 family protein [Rhizobium calliandrae]|uniref:DUF7673 family protein n=1 Tax=Rhizobium calliandrae TaxID=1312182 RepID=UPI003D80AE90
MTRVDTAHTAIRKDETEQPESAMEDRVRFALEKLLNVAHEDTGQGRRVANFLLAWWNAEVHGGFDLADLFAVDREVSEDMATIFTCLAREETPSTPPTIAARSRKSSSAGGLSPPVSRGGTILGSIGELGA